MRPLPHCFFFVQHNHALSVAISSPPTSSTLTTACYAFYPTTPHAATVVETFSTSPSDVDAWLGPVLATPVRSFVPDVWLCLANPDTPRLRWLDCIDFGIDPPVPIPSASIASSPFFYVHDALDYIDFGIASSHDDCLDASPSSSWRPSRACSSIDMAIRPQLHRSRPSSARLLRPRLLCPHARLPRHRHKRATALHEDSSTSSPATAYTAH